MVQVLRSSIVLFILVLGSSFAQTEWPMHVAWPESNFHTQGTLKLAELVSEKTDGSFEIQVSAGGALGFQGQEVLAVVRDGTLPIAENFMSNAQGDEAVLGLTALPLLASNYEEAWDLYQTAKPMYEAALARHNQMLLYAAPWPPSGMYTEGPIAGPSDLEGLKMRTYDANSASFAEGLGAQGLAIPFSELYTALSTGLINAVLTSSQTGVDASLWEVTDNFTRINYAFPLNMVTVNKDSFDKLSAVEKVALITAGNEVEAMQWANSAGADESSAATLEENGMGISSEVSAELDEAMKAVAAELEGSWLELAGDEGSAILEIFRK